mgnify:CR=1 FL=1
MISQVAALNYDRDSGGRLWADGADAQTLITEIRVVI